MNFGRKSVSQRLLAMLLCAAMVLSYIVLPSSATEATDTAEQTTAPKLTLSGVGVNSYAANAPVLVKGGSIESLGMIDFISKEVSQFVNLMPVQGEMVYDVANEAIAAVPTFNTDGTVTVTNQLSKSYWPYTYMEPMLEVNLDKNPYIYISYSGTAKFNLIFTYVGGTNSVSTAALGYNASVNENNKDFVPGKTADEVKTYCFNLAEEMGKTNHPSTGKITINKCLYYVNGASESYVKIQDICLVSNSTAGAQRNGRTGSYMDNYTAIVVDYKGGVASQEGVNGAEYVVSAVLDCSEVLDFPPQQLKATTENGFVVYVPKDRLTADTMPAVGDYVDAGIGSGTATLDFYDYTQYTLKQDALSGLNVNKTASPVKNTNDEFLLTLEAFATGTSSSSVSTTPADIVLVLDQSASMYTPKGATADRYTRWDNPATVNGIDGIGKVEANALDRTKGSKLAYYVAQSKTANRTVAEGSNDYNGNGKTGETLSVYDWFIVQYVDGIGWIYIRVADTTTSVTAAENKNDIDDYASASGSQYGATLVSSSVAGSVITDFYYYESQYSALYESVTDFVNKLAATGVDHRVAITGFSSPYYDGIQYYNGSGLYIDGKYYLYDTDYRYMGYATDANPHGLMLYVPTDVYNSMSNILPAELEGITWSKNLPDGAELVYLDPNQSNSAGTTIIANGKTFEAGQYFAPVKADASLTNYNVVGDDQYSNALVSVRNSASIINSVNAVRTNFQQTCPAAGLDMAQKIFAANTVTERDQIVILFTDGVPTVSLNANREYGETGDAGVKETYYSGLSGVKDAVNMAYTLKQSDAQIYTIGTSGLTAEASSAYGVQFQSGATTQSISGETFLEYVSSEYKNAQSTHTVATPSGNNTVLSKSVLSFTGTEKTSESDYTKTSAEGSISVAFGSIMESQFTPNVTLGKDAVLKDVMGENFDLRTRSAADITVSIAPYIGKTILGEHIFGDPITLAKAAAGSGEAAILGGIAPTLSISNEEIAVNVTGFDYSANHVRVENGAAKGYKIIVQIAIKTKEGFQGGDNVPTNAPTSAIYNGEALVQAFPIPEVDVAGVVTDKFVNKAEDDEYVITLEGFATGSTTQMNITKPADIVLVLDHSGSMRTPVGATEVLDTSRFYDGEGQLKEEELDAELGQHIGYYIGHSKVYNTWWILRFVEATQKWEGFSVPTTECFVDPTKDPNKDPFNTYTGTQHTMKLTWDYGSIDDNLVFYKTQYAMLYDSVLAFVAGLKESGDEHNVAIVGFAGQNTFGSRLYVGGDEDTVKKYETLCGATAARQAELYQKAMKNVQDEAEYAQLMSNIESIETNYSFTCPSAGLDLANRVYGANDINEVERDRIVVLFTDGIPNNTLENKAVGATDLAGNTITQDYIYNEIVRKAYESKNTYGATLYSISTTTMGTNANRDFLKYASSDYPNATGYATPGNPIANPVFTSEVSGLGDLELAFQTITTNVTSTVSLNNSAMLLDLLTDYFDLSEKENAVTAYTQVYDGKGGWGEKVVFSTAVVEKISSKGDDRIDTISVTGFNYANEYISSSPRAKTDADGNVITDEYYGSKLVVEVRIKARDGFWGGNNVPTNGPDTGIYADGERVQKLPEPHVNVPVTPVINANDVTIYYGGEVSEDDLGVTVEIDGVQVTINKDGTLTPAEDWMDDFVTLTWADPNMNPADGNDPTKNTEKNTHAYTVVLTPTESAAEGSVGEAVEEKTVSDTGTVNILVPVVTFKDSTIEYGTTPDQNHYETMDRVTTGGTAKNPGVTWVQIGTDTPGTATDPSTEPKLSYSYTTDGTTGGTDDFKSDTKVQVTVNSDNVNGAAGDITTVVKFQWDECDSKLDHSGHTHEIPTHIGSDASHEFWIHVKQTSGVADSVVIDFGLSVNINVKNNDTLLSTGTTVVVGFVANSGDDLSRYKTELAGVFGTAQLTGVDGVVRYTLNKTNGMQMEKEETVYYVLAHTVGENVTYYCAQLTIIPATTIYYEDDFVDYTIWNTNGTDILTDDTEWEVSNGVKEEWKTAPEDNSVPTQSIQDEDRPGEGLSDALNNYGYDGHYIDMTTYSNGTARWVTVSGNKYAKATFTFKGTAFDVISVTSADTGTIVVEVDDLNKNEGEKGDKSYFVVDTYYGYTRKFYEVTYTYQDGKWTVTAETLSQTLGESQSEPANPAEGATYTVYETRWVVDPDATDALYQIPVMKVDMETYSRYQVTITATYADFFDHDQNDQNGSYDFYLDAIRIYDPANKGTENEVIKDAYIADGEYLPTYQELRNLLIDKNTFDSLEGADSTVNGIVFIDGNQALAGDLYPNGSQPMNPVAGKTYQISDYLNYGPNNELYLAPNQAVAFTLDANDRNVVQLALKTVKDGASVKVGRYESGEIVWFMDKDITTATDLYYDISDAERSERTLVIMNDGESGILSITNIKTAYSADPYGAVETAVFSTRGGYMRDLLAALNAENAQPEQDAPSAGGESNPQTGDMAFELLALTVLTACVMMLAVLVRPVIRKRDAQ